MGKYEFDFTLNGTRYTKERDSAEMIVDEPSEGPSSWEDESSGTTLNVIRALLELHKCGFRVAGFKSHLP